MGTINKDFKVLHIANDFTGSAVYTNLCKALDAQNINQIIYTAVRNSNLINRNLFQFKIVTSKILYSNILNLFTRLNFKFKIKKIFLDIENKVDFDHVSVIHAHTWYSDGAVAFELYKKYNIPYVVTIRNTDLNLFYKYFYHLRKYGLDILKNAKKIVFISQVYKTRLLSESTFKKENEISSKTLIIPNGIDQFWISNIISKKSSLGVPPKLLFIGKFTKGKNLFRIIKAIELLRNNGKSVELTIVGGGGGQQKKVLKQIGNKNYITYLGKIHEKEKLKEIYRSSDVFIMPSKSETFGLVYIEALTQGLPVIFTKNEGIDGFFNNSIGESVKYNDITRISEGIGKILDNYDKYSINSFELLKNFNWSDISLQYKSLYTNIVSFKTQNFN